MKQKLLVLALIGSACTTFSKELHWNWNKINTSDLKFPKEFLWGVASAAYHVEGDLYNNNWSEWEKKGYSHGKPTIREHEKCGKACDHWNRYKEDYQLIKDLGLKAYRFSIEWSRVEPEIGVYDEDAIAQYKEMCQELVNLGIKPVITIHHFTNPTWFDELGGFEKSENIAHLVRFSEKLFTEFKDYCDMWCTINEPGVYAAHGYFLGDFPPGHKNLELAAMVLENMLNTHVEIYKKIKSLPGGQEAQVGIVKQYFQFDPYNRYNPLDKKLCKYLDGIFNESIMGFLQNGHFKVKIPMIVDHKSTNSEAPKSYDFFGLNYYSHAVLKLKFNPNEFFEIKYRDGDIVTELPHSIYPEGIYRALHDADRLGVPIYITENGVADGSDTHRKLFLQQYLWATSQAIKEGVDVRGYFHWTLTDNFEWAEGYHPRFGLYHIDFETQKRTARPSSQYLKAIAQKHS